MRRDEIDTFRHYLIFPHDPNKLVGRIRLSLKHAYICLTYLVYKETGRLPKTRLETIEFFKKKNSQELGISLLKILENWAAHERRAYENPDDYLYLLEEFWRTLAS